MTNEDANQTDYEHPVAYDANGKPLYSHPKSEHTKSVHISRPIELEQPFISDATKLKHDKSVQMYPYLNLSDGEYIITSVHRHIIGLLVPFSIGILLISIAFSILFNYNFIIESLKLSGTIANPSIIFFPIILFVILVVLATYVVYYVFINNKFFLTNESVIQQTQTGLFSKREQTISLGHIEDASYSQSGIIQQLVNYGSIRLSTIGEENTYTLSYVAVPKEQVDFLNNAVEAFHNGRPVGIN